MLAGEAMQSAASPRGRHDIVPVRPPVVSMWHKGILDGLVKATNLGCLVTPGHLDVDLTILQIVPNRSLRSPSETGLRGTER